ncbi:MAG: hypothetical protein ACFFCH_00705 [Promethearchaeota archaeon]
MKSSRVRIIFETILFGAMFVNAIFIAFFAVFLGQPFLFTCAIISAITGGFICGWGIDQLLRKPEET